MTFTGRFLLLPRGSAVEPYIGAGLVAIRYRYSEVGEFVADIGDIFPARYLAEGTAVGPTVLGGLRAPVEQLDGRRGSALAESRSARACSTRDSSATSSTSAAGRRTSRSACASRSRIEGRRIEAVHGTVRPNVRSFDSSILRLCDPSRYNADAAAFRHPIVAAQEVRIVRRLPVQRVPAFGAFLDRNPLDERARVRDGVLPDLAVPLVQEVADPRSRAPTGRACSGRAIPCSSGSAGRPSARRR